MSYLVTLYFVWFVDVAGLFARKLVVSEQEKELRRLEKKKAKESRNKKKW